MWIAITDTSRPSSPNSESNSTARRDSVGYPLNASHPTSTIIQQKKTRARKKTHIILSIHNHLDIKNSSGSSKTFQKNEKIRLNHKVTYYLHNYTIAVHAKSDGKPFDFGRLLGNPKLPSFAPHTQLPAVRALLILLFIVPISDLPTAASVSHEQHYYSHIFITPRLLSKLAGPAIGMKS
ncbi:hypothetical protein CPC08DRAFT_729000, partial [Agrocybe pediades]